MSTSVLLKINGVVRDTLLTVSAPDEKAGIVQEFVQNHIAEPSKDFVQSRFYEYIVQPAVTWCGETLHALGHFLDVHSVDLITLGLMWCGVAIMFSPFTNKSPGVWLGRAGLLCMLGTAWRIGLA